MQQLYIERSCFAFVDSFVVVCISLLLLRWRFILPHQPVSNYKSRRCRYKADSGSGRCDVLLWQYFIVTRVYLVVV